jgi:hypothetical protein
VEAHPGARRRGRGAHTWVMTGYRTAGDSGEPQRSVHGRVCRRSLVPARHLDQGPTRSGCTQASRLKLGAGRAMSGEFRLEMRKTGRGERDSPSRTQRPDGFLLINRTPPRTAEETA